MKVLWLWIGVFAMLQTYEAAPNTTSINSSHELPLHGLLIASSEFIFLQDIDSDKNETLIQDVHYPIVLGCLIKESKLFWINSIGYLKMYNMLDSKTTKMVHLEQFAISLTVDWLARIVYVAQNDMTDINVWKIDLNYFDRGIVKTVKVFAIRGRLLVRPPFEVSPYNKKLYWAHFPTLTVFHHDVDQSETIDHVWNEGSRIKCGNNYRNCSSVAEIEAFTLDHSTETKPLIVFVDSSTGSVISADENACLCQVVANSSRGFGFRIRKIKSDYGSLCWVSNKLLHIWKQNEPTVVTKKIDVADMVILGSHTQPFPPEECLRPKQQTDFRVKLNSATSNDLTFHMPEIIHVCRNTMPTIEYRIYYKQEDNESVSLALTFEKQYTITDLKPFTNYMVSVAVSNHYTDDEQVVIGPELVFQTAVGAPSPPQNVTVTVLSPEMAKVTWWPSQELNGPRVHYEVYGETEDGPYEFRRYSTQLPPNSTHFWVTVLNQLNFGATYTVSVQAYSEGYKDSSDSEKVRFTTYPQPSDLVLVNKTKHVLTLVWHKDPHVVDYNVQFAYFSSNHWKNITIGNRTSDTIVIVTKNLTIASYYKFRMCLFYENYSGGYSWPRKFWFTFKTLGNKPSRPDSPKIKRLNQNLIEVFWKGSEDNETEIELYKLEGLNVYDFPTFELWKWQLFCNVSDTSCTIDGLSEHTTYIFRVSALSEYGWSETSKLTTAFEFDEDGRIHEIEIDESFFKIAKTIVTGPDLTGTARITSTAVTTTFVAISVLAIVLYIACQRYCISRKVRVVSAPENLDTTLTTLGALPRRGVLNTNALYVPTKPSSDKSPLLQHIRRDQIALLTFLGSGAFGEVFEGRITGASKTSTEVAVKTLREGATEQEKAEFLKEAHLMSNFEHEHILQLLGVCLDRDPYFIIMELMRGGDLLTYLRSSRTPNIDTPSLSLFDHLKMGVDVAKGCRYLEAMHFVHRDLACRNCLVSSKAPNLVVKIGDFGLARDAYKDDYYRKEGQGLLPVRWMAPESLIDGVFSSQSDVWAFGVVLWEIMTLGHQPYPARSHLEVMNFVGRGGKLEKPTDCPETLYNLMLKCWEFETQKRPTFKYCLDILKNFHCKQTLESNRSTV